jgi:hypothetical protein
MFAGNISEVPEPIYDPQSFSPKSRVRTQFPGNVTKRFALADRVEAVPLHTFATPGRLFEE